MKYGFLCLVLGLLSGCSFLGGSAQTREAYYVPIILSDRSVGKAPTVNTIHRADQGFGDNAYYVPTYKK